MELNVYIAQKLAEARLRDLHAASARTAAVVSAHPGRGGFRFALRAALVGAGRWLLRGTRQGRLGSRHTRTPGRSEA
jgi:hypothetical protein